jgi:CO dehydrogenase/acetyl-CoA synthase delta subunit
VKGFTETDNGPVPQVQTALNFRDHLGTMRARSGIARNQYKINPGLYCVGSPTPESPILVTANYKLSFDALRKELTDLDIWILVIDTRGINVWCAAGKGTFSTDEVALQVQRAGLEKIVSHKELILPQFSASGVATHQLKKKCGFKAIFGPLKAEDIPQFLQNNKKADEKMRTVTFSFSERLVLVPVEILLVWKFFVLISIISFAISGIGQEIYSLSTAWTRGLVAAGATFSAVFAGALITPLLLPWTPGRQFWFKGTVVGAFSGLAYILTIMEGAGSMEKVGIWFWIVAAASYMAMNFTGATPFTSLSGVEKEMRTGLPAQLMGMILGLSCWIAAPFLS